MTSNPSASAWLATPGSIDVDANVYDEERLQWESHSRWHTLARTNLRVPRLRRVGLGLLLLDLMIVGFLLHTFDPLITLLRRNEELFGARLTLPLHTPLKDDSHPPPHKVPRIFHQTSATTVIPDKWKASVNRCKEVYSGFEYMHWTDASAREFIATEYAWALDLWDNYPFPIQRADAIRYFVLHKYGGLYLDMDTTCNRAIPLNYIESNDARHHAVFKSTTPTGVSNDLLIATPNHPVFAKALSRLRFYNDFTTLWANLLPHAAVMIAAGPLFLTMAIKNYLLEQPSLPEQTVQVINATELLPYMTDLEGSSWHHGDTKFLMWLEHKPWIWFLLAAIGLALGLHLINYLLLKGLKRFEKAASATDELELKRYRD